jgi:hypothetical protein
MYRDIWKKSYQSVAAINLFDENGIEIGYFSGFKISHFLITDAGIGKNSRAQVAEIKFTGNDGYTVTASKRLHYSELITRHMNTHDKTVDQFAVIDIEYKEFENIQTLIIDNEEELEIGMPLALFGYQYDQPNLSIKSGILGTILHYPDNKKYLQFDGFIKKGNAGGPILSGLSGNVLGIIGYKLSKAVKTYNQLINIINGNIEVLKEAEGKFKISEVDPMQVLVANQNQIKQLAGEIYKSASMGVGYALSSWSISDFFKRNRIDISPQKDALFNAR